MQLFEKTLGDFLEYWAEKTPDKEFIVYSDRDLRFTYSEFNKRVNRSRKRLQSRYLGDERTRLAHIPVCFCQDRCNSGYCKYKLQAT